MVHLFRELSPTAPVPFVLLCGAHGAISRDPESPLMTRIRLMVGGDRRRLDLVPPVFSLLGHGVVDLFWRQICTVAIVVAHLLRESRVAPGPVQATGRGVGRVCHRNDLLLEVVEAIPLLRARHHAADLRSLTLHIWAVEEGTQGIVVTVGASLLSHADLGAVSSTPAALHRLTSVALALVMGMIDEALTLAVRTWLLLLKQFRIDLKGLLIAAGERGVQLTELEQESFGKTFNFDAVQALGTQDNARVHATVLEVTKNRRCKPDAVDATTFWIGAQAAEAEDNDHVPVHDRLFDSVLVSNVRS